MDKNECYVFVLPVNKGKAHEKRGTKYKFVKKRNVSYEYYALVAYISLSGQIRFPL